MQAHRLKAGFSINKSAWATAGCVVRDEGIRGLWAGVSASCVRTACGAGLYFLLLERVTRELNAKFPVSKDSSQTVQGARTFAVGAASRALAAAMLCPLTVVKTRMEYASISGTTYTGVANALYVAGFLPSQTSNALYFTRSWPGAAGRQRRHCCCCPAVFFASSWTCNVDLYRCLFQDKHVSLVQDADACFGINICSLR